MRKLVFLLGLLFFFSGCRWLRTPKRAFDQYEHPAPPVYSDTTFWAALPFMKDPADSIPVHALSDNQSKAAVDVFFIYPTLYLKAKNWNAPVAKTKFNREVDESTILHQASVFNGSCRVFAPRYRQMTYYGFYDEEGERECALELAFSDVATAFQYYLAHWNNGRPFIIAGHSQGSLMALMLLQQVVDGKPIQDQLVAAYLAGWPIKPSDLKAIPLCKGPNQTHCYVTWNTVAWDYKLNKRSKQFFREAQCVNPLTWEVDTSYVGYNQNEGSLTRKYDTLLPFVTDAQIHGSLLWIHRDRLPGLAHFMKRFHVADYNLFWSSIRENVAQRILAYQAKQ